MASPWGKIPKVETNNLTDIMSEEVARHLQEKEFACFTRPSAHINPSLNQENEKNILNDQEIAMMLQQQYDKEYDQMLKHCEDKLNGSCKVSVSFSNYRRAPLNPDFESDVEEEEEPENLKKDWDSFDRVERDYKELTACGYQVKDGNAVTKHDTTLNGRRNACRMMSFPPDCDTGDGAKFDLQLSNKVFNSLRSHSKHASVRRHHIDRKEEHATVEFGIDESTRLLIFKMINNQLLEKVNGLISIGKEAVILHADCNRNYSSIINMELPAECVLKVFKTTVSEFKQRDKYIKDDHRFKDRIGKQTTKKVVHLWAEKEMRNLGRLKKANIPVPNVITLKKHVLVMSFIGINHKPAPKLKDAKLSEEDLIAAHKQVIEAMNNLYHKANLIHADLSEYNILWYKKQCFIIDVSQAVEPSHENAFHFLFRDCVNVCNFFRKRSVEQVDTPEKLFKSIVGMDFRDQIGLPELQENFKMKPHLVDTPGFDLDYRFDAAWQKNEYAKLEAIAVRDTCSPHEI